MRVETMVAMAGFEIPTEFLRKYISSAINVVIQTARMADGTRKIVSLQEITGMEGSVTSLQEIFVFEQTGVDTDGRVKGRFRATGIRPRFVEKFHIMNIPFQAGMFDPGMHFEV